MSVHALKVPAERVEHELLSIDALTIDPRVQRREGVQQGRAEAMAAEFDPHALGAITVSRRANGSLVLLDGAHRCAAARIAEYDKPLHALVYTGLTLAQEAAMFNLLNTFRQPSYISRTLARVVAGEPDATAIVGTIEKHGWVVGFDSHNGHFAAIQAAERVYRNGAGTLAPGEYPEVLDRTIGLLTSAWRHDRESAHNMLVLGTGQLLGRFGEAVDSDALSARLAKERPYNIVGKAKAMQALQGGTTAASLAKVLVGIYNTRRRSSLLPEWVWTR